MKTHKNLFDKIISLENLFSAWDAFKNDKKSKIDVQKFEYLAKLGREIPRVTGIVAGYGIIATLTEDLSEGGLYELEVNTSGASGIVKSSRDGKQHQVVCADLKCEFPPDIQIRMLTSKQEMNIESNYFLERLQIDKS